MDAMWHDSLYWRWFVVVKALAYCRIYTRHGVRALVATIDDGHDCIFFVGENNNLVIIHGR